MCKPLLLLALLLAITTVAWSDVIEFKNGDRLTGQVVRMEQRRVIIASQVAGEIGVPITGIQRFSTADVVSMMLEDGTILHARVALYEGEKFQLAPAAATTRPTTAPATRESTPAPTAPAVLEGRTVPLSEVARIGPSKPEWRGRITAGALVSRGNSNSDSVQAGVEVSRRADRNRTELSANYAYGRQEDPDTGEEFTTTDNWRGRAKHDYFLTPRWYLYGIGTVDHDTLADLQLRASPGVGVGYQWIESNRTNFSTETGANWIYEQYDNPSRTDTYMALRFAWHFDHRLNDATQFIHNAEFLPNISDFGDEVINADAGLRVKLTGRLFTELKLVLNYDSKPAEDKESLDLRYVLNLGYEF